MSGTDDMELEALLKRVKTSDLKAEAKKRGISCGRCPKKMDIARKLPRDVVAQLAEK